LRYWRGGTSGCDRHCRVHDAPGERGHRYRTRQQRLQAWERLSPRHLWDKGPSIRGVTEHGAVFPGQRLWGSGQWDTARPPGATAPARGLTAPDREPGFASGAVVAAVYPVAAHGDTLLPALR